MGQRRLRLRRGLLQQVKCDTGPLQFFVDLQQVRWYPLLARRHRPKQPRPLSDPDALDLVQGDLLLRSVVELARSWGLVVADPLGLGELGAAQQEGRDPGRPEGVAVQN